MKRILLLLVMALAIAILPAFGQVGVQLGVFEGGHDVAVGAPVAKDVHAGFRYRQNSGGNWAQDVVAGVNLSSRYSFSAGGHWNNLSGNRAFGPMFDFTGNHKGPAGFVFVYGARGYPSMDNDSRGAGWSVGVRRNLGSVVGVYVGHDWDSFWPNGSGPTQKLAGVTAGVTFRLGG